MTVETAKKAAELLSQVQQSGHKVSGAERNLAEREAELKRYQKNYEDHLEQLQEMIERARTYLVECQHRAQSLAEQLEALTDLPEVPATEAQV